MEQDTQQSSQKNKMNIKNRKLIKIPDESFKPLVIFLLMSNFYLIMFIGLFIILAILREGLGLRIIPIAILIGIYGMIKINRMIKLITIRTKNDKQ